MKYLALYYSGAGNTELIAGKIAKRLKDQGNEVISMRITQTSIKSLDNDFEALILGFPIYFRAPQPLVMDALNRMEGLGRPAILFCTKGLYSGNVMAAIGNLANERGFITKGFHEFFMPGTDALILYCPKGSIRERLFKLVHSRNIDSKIDNLINTIHHGANAKLPGRKWYTTLDEKVVKTLEARYTNHYQVFIDQLHALMERCVQCGLCVEQCPHGNIQLTQTKVIFGDICDTCFRCVHHCPTEAIQIADMTMDNVRYRPAES